ncbi:methyl-accepting chemotaxis domain protein, partial [Vibrio parahaemolyticus V-223/04]
TGAKALLWRCQ